MLNNKIKMRNLSAILVTIFVIALIVVPFFFALQVIGKETYQIYLLSKQKVLTEGLLNANCIEDNFVCNTAKMLASYMSDPKISYQLQRLVERSTSFIMDSLGDFVLSIPMILLNFFIMIFITFYLLKDGKDIANKVKSLLPLKKHYQIKVIEKSKDVTFAVVYGHLFVALIQGGLGCIGFLIFGVQSPLLWGLVMSFAALIPLVGTPIIWLPVALFRIFNGYTTGNKSILVNGILLLLYGSLIIGTIDNLLKPKIIGEKAKVHPILVLLGVLGGLKLFGIIGIIIGPVVLAVLKIVIEIYEAERGLI